MSIIQQKEQTASASFEWNFVAVLQSVSIFILAGFAEIIGGWLIWAAVRGIRTESTIEGNDVTPAADSTLDEDNNPSNTEDYTILKKPWYFALFGSLTLVAYGFLPCFQPSASSDGFGRIYAAYGGFFVVLSFLLGWALEGSSAKPDVGDFIGGAIALVGVGVIMFWPRG